MTTLTLYGKPGCHLCDDARREVAALASELGFAVEEVDISTDPELFRRYGELIPVGVLGEEQVFEFHVDEPALRTALGRVAGS